MNNQIISICICLGAVFLITACNESVPNRDTKSQDEVLETVAEFTLLAKKTTNLYDKSEYDKHNSNLLAYASELSDEDKTEIFKIVRKEIKIVPYRVFPDQKRTEKENISWIIVDALLATTVNKNLITMIVSSTPSNQVGHDELVEYLKTNNFSEADMKNIVEKSENEKVRAFLIDCFARAGFAFGS